MWKRRTLLLTAAGTGALAVAPWTGLEGAGISIEGAVKSLWTGAVTENSVTATAVVTEAIDPIRLVASTRADFSGFLHYSDPLDCHTDYRYGRGRIAGLTSDTAYHLGVTIGGALATDVIGTFRTSPAGRHSFSFAAGSCAKTGSKALVFDNIRRRALDFFVHLGDLHYENIEENEEARFHAAYDKVFQSRRQGACWREVPMYYMWDDHDYAGNDSDGTSVSREAAVTAFRHRVPSPPLAATGALDPVYYAFRRGRVRFVVSDTRSARSSRKAPESARTVLGDKQTAWFRRQLAAAREGGEVILWVNSTPWISEGRKQKDRWGSYATHRAMLAAMIVAEGMEQAVAVLSGDMHALAFDDGTNDRAGLPVMHAAPLDRSNSEKGGPYTYGPVTASKSQYGVVDVADDGGRELAIRFRGITVDRKTGVENVPIDAGFTLVAGGGSS
jgi:phosphodiesterase/alkaline phosphatase D-like protein